MKNMEKHKKQILTRRRCAAKGVFLPAQKIHSYEHKQSRHVRDFSRIYGVSIKNSKEIFKLTGITPEQQGAILKKGAGAFYSNGSLPVRKVAWKYARLASALLGRKACEVDKKILLPSTCSQLRLLARSQRKS